MLTIRDQEDCIIGGKTFAEEFFKEFMQEFFGPPAEDLLRMALLNMTKEQRAQVKQLNPEAYEIVTEQIGWKEK